MIQLLTIQCIIGCIIRAVIDFSVACSLVLHTRSKLVYTLGLNSLNSRQFHHIASREKSSILIHNSCYGLWHLVSSLVIAYMTGDVIFFLTVLKSLFPLFYNCYKPWMDKPCVLSVGVQDCVGLQLIGTTQSYFCDLRCMQSNTKQRWNFFSLLIGREGKFSQSYSTVQM